MHLLGSVEAESVELVVSKVDQPSLVILIVAYFADLPSRGDIQLQNDGLVLIYMGSDRTNYDHMWGTLDGWSATYQGTVAKTLCLQLGHSSGTMHLRSTNLIIQGKEWWSH